MYVMTFKPDCNLIPRPWINFCPARMHKGTIKQLVVSLCHLLSSRKWPDLGIWVTQIHVNLLKPAKNWLHYASNRLTRSTGVTYQDFIQDFFVRGGNVFKCPLIPPTPHHPPDKVYFRDFWDCISGLFWTKISVDRFVVEKYISAK